MGKEDCGRLWHLPRHRADTADQMTLSCEKLMSPSFPPPMSASLMTPLSISCLLYLCQILNLQRRRTNTILLIFIAGVEGARFLILSEGKMEWRHSSSTQYSVNLLFNDNPRLSRFSAVGCRKSKTKSQQTKTTHTTNQNSKSTHATVVKRGKTNARKSRLVCVLLLIG